MKKEEYIESILSQIKDKYAKIEVKKELETHLDDRIAFYTDAGYDEEYALFKAIERMGNADEIGEKLSGVHNTEKYIKLAYTFTILYGLGAILGLVLTLLYFFRVIDLAEYSALPCVCSVIVFLIASLGFVYSQKAQDDGAFILFSGVSLFNWIAAPLTFIPCGFSILALFFEFPYALFVEGEFEYFYYPFLSTSIEFLNPSESVSELASIILWILMCAFALFPIFSGIISFNSFLKNKDEPNRKFIERAKRYGTFLLILGIIGVASITTEMALEKSVLYINYTKLQNRYDFDFDEGWKIFNSISLPISLEEAKTDAKQNGCTNDEEDLDYTSQFNYYENFCCYVLLENKDYDTENKFPEYFDSAYFANLYTSELSTEAFDSLCKFKVGSSENELWKLVSPRDLADCEIIYDDSSDKTIIKKYYTFECENYNIVNLYFENGKLKENNKETVYEALDN